MINIPFLEQKLIDDIEYYNFSLIKNLEAVELILYICKTIIDYLQDNILQMSYDNITVNIYDSIFDLYRIQLEDIWYLYSTDTNTKEDIINSLNNDIYNCILVSNNIIYKYFIPVRSYPTSFIRVQQNENKKNNLDRKISMLKNIPQPEQRTEEWYKFRHTTLTASSIWKIFYSEASQNQLIYEKCKPLEIINNTSTNIDTPFHWGQKYEPLSVLYYQYIYNTIVDDFGCIPHSEYEYIAASPDGINCKRDNERYGRMLEIKNIVNRDITGIPKMEYWIQMQLQMETCDLNECDFLETRFIEYTTIEEFTDDPDFLENSTTGINSNGKNVYRGYILHFEGERGPKYEYHDFGMSLDEIKDYLKKIIDDGIIVIPNTSKTQSEIEEFIKDLKSSIPEIVFIYSENSARSYLNLLKKYNLLDIWMETNLMCLGEKASSVLNEIKWKKIFLFNPGEEEYLLYKI